MKKALLILGSLLAIAVVVGLIIWNKPHKKAEDEAGIAVSASSLYKAYTSNEQAANAQYLNKVLEVTGDILSTEKNQDGQTVAVLKATESDDLMPSGIMCTMRDKNVNVPPSGSIVIKGFCTGFANDVHLTDCIVK